MNFDSERVAIGLLQFDEAIEDEDRHFSDEAEDEAQPEGPNIGLGVGEDDADPGHQDGHQDEVIHRQLL